MAKGGELFDLLLARGTPTEAQTATLMKALISAVAYVHMHGIIHGDIKVRGKGRRQTADGGRQGNRSMGAYRGIPCVNL